MTVIENGVGTRRPARVDEEFRLHVNSLSFDLIQARAESGDSYIASTYNVANSPDGVVALTAAAGYQGVLYIQNNHADKEFHVSKLSISGDTAGHIDIKFIKNPTTGTLISDANTGAMENTNFESPSTFTGNIYVASAAAKTVTDGSHYMQFTSPAPGTLPLDMESGTILNTTRSIAVMVKVSVDMNVGLSVIGFYEDEGHEG